MRKLSSKGFSSPGRLVMKVIRLKYLQSGYYHGCVNSCNHRSFKFWVYTFGYFKVVFSFTCTCDTDHDVQMDQGHERRWTAASVPHLTVIINRLHLMCCKLKEGRHTSTVLRSGLSAKVYTWRPFLVTRY